MLEVAKVIREDFLQQNAFSDYDFTCPLHKSVGMLRVIIRFYNGAQKAIADSPPEARVTWAQIKTALSPVVQKIIGTKFLAPKMPKEQMKKEFDALCDEIDNAFQNRK